MIGHKLNLLHILLVVSAAGCLGFAWRENRRRTVRLAKLFWSSWFAVATALLLVFFQIGMKQPGWPFLGALVSGLAVGGLRGAMMKLEVDEYWLIVRPAGRRTLVWVATLVFVAALVDVAAAVVGASAITWRFGATLVATAGCGLMLGRALAMATRVWRLVG